MLDHNTMDKQQPGKKRAKGIPNSFAVDFINKKPNKCIFWFADLKALVNVKQ